MPGEDCGKAAGEPEEDEHELAATDCQQCQADAD
jgi:hypothetical protein